MCRFIAYLGKPIILHHLLYKPFNSLIKQSTHAREMEEPLNGDGFGLSWYLPEIDEFPGVFKSIQPAWSDKNLERLSSKIMSGCFLAHVRAASAGDVNPLNTHPFNYNALSFMHNGDIAGFVKIKRYLRRYLSDSIYNWIQGQTDSEHFFALFLEFLQRTKKPYQIGLGPSLMRKTIHYVETLQKKFHIEESNYINMVISDGHSLMASRYVSNAAEQAPSLHFSVGYHLECKDGHHYMLSSPQKKNSTVLIASEKLSAHKGTWYEVPPNHLLLVNSEAEVKLEPLKANSNKENEGLSFE